MTHFPTTVPDPFDLRRFVAAQNPLYATIRSELRIGRKRTHWMWFVFPQAAGLGDSELAVRFAIHSRKEGIAYGDHPLLSPRLLESTLAVLGHDDLSAHQIFGSPDDLKFQSCMTLFHMVSGQPIFLEALKRFYDAKPDQATIDIVQAWSG